MTVWLLCTGTEYDDYGVSRVYASEEDALKGAEQHMKDDPDPPHGAWEKMPLFKQIPGVACARHMWSRGNDRVWLTPHEVLGTAPGDTKESK